MILNAQNIDFYRNEIIVNNKNFLHNITRMEKRFKSTFFGAKKCITGNHIHRRLKKNERLAKVTCSTSSGKNFDFKAFKTTDNPFFSMFYWQLSMIDRDLSAIWLTKDVEHYS
uniref:Uncharacterized protein n=1 Tax=Romanomermis culicivorax TaxID=13658 RepID=A0A915K3X8_ROMCU